MTDEEGTQTLIPGASSTATNYDTGEVTSQKRIIVDFLYDPATFCKSDGSDSPVESHFKVLVCLRNCNCVTA